MKPTSLSSSGIIFSYSWPSQELSCLLQSALYYSYGQGFFSLPWRWVPGKQELAFLFRVLLYTARHADILETIGESKWAELIMNHYWVVNTAPLSCFWLHDQTQKKSHIYSRIWIKHIDSPPIFMGRFYCFSYLMKNIQLLKASFSSRSREAIR